MRGRGVKDDPPWPRRPLLTALWIPGAAVLLPLVGVLGAFGPWLLVPSVALIIAVLVGLVHALLSLCRSRPLRIVALPFVLAPLIAVPLLSLEATRATVLDLRGVAHPGTVTGVRVSHGRTTTYRCAVRYEDAPGHGGSVTCGAGDTVGERVGVTEDPGGLVEPEFTAAAGSARGDLALAGFFDVVLLVVAGTAAGLGALLHLARGRTARRPPGPPPPRNPLAG
ncbi:hypothetical protein ACIRD3_04215 [Kitasatospora sp. NPDC093550]|uniref:hypothetical protein n=1 Tax=Kitasatospora sp. NPDC093550 TaxID=3364089 RepID=UPI00382FF3D9